MLRARTELMRGPLYQIEDAAAAWLLLMPCLQWLVCEDVWKVPGNRAVCSEATAHSGRRHVKKIAWLLLGGSMQILPLNGLGVQESGRSSGQFPC